MDGSVEAKPKIILHLREDGMIVETLGEFYAKKRGLEIAEDQSLVGETYEPVIAI